MVGFFSTLQGKKVAIIGAGVSHKELIPMFAKAGAVVTLCDMKKAEDFGAYAEELQTLGVKLCLGQGYLEGLKGQQMILRTPGFDFFTPELVAAGRAGAEITSELELFFEHCPCPITGITGSDGKTTTTSLIAAMYRAAGGRQVHLGGNIGRALLPIVDEISSDDIAVVELSSFQLISMRTSPKTAVVTNVTPNHLDHHKDMQEYVDAKRNILLHQSENSLAVLGLENEISHQMQADVRGEVRWFSRLRDVENGAHLNAGGMLCVVDYGDETPVVHREDVALRGLHNIENLLAAMATVCGSVPVEVMRDVAKTFAGVEHRIEPVRTLNGVRWFNDSIATSPARVMAGLRAFDEKLILIMGGYDKKLDYTPMAPLVLEKVKLLILAGQTADIIENVVRAAPGFDKSGLEICRADALPQAVKLAAEKAVPGDVVTLSPGSSAFDAYTNFEYRGRHFKELVNAL